MSKVKEFEATLFAKDKKIAKWHKIDLHNHTPNSFDYKYNGADVVDKICQKIIENDLSVVMFTDHNVLPDIAFVNEIANKTKRLIIRGIELNIFVNAFGVDVGKNLFFHLLIGFDPEAAQSPDYWLSDLKRHCQWETRDSGGTPIEGITDSMEKVFEVLKDSNAIMIPAHLHSGKDAYKSRSVDKIYSDKEFLRFCKNNFSAVEVTDSKTATFFDGKHSETDNIWKSCIQSSDSHHPDQLGWRPSFVQMEKASFKELKAALELPFRVSISKPVQPSSYVIGIQVNGQYLKEVWHQFSPHCNVSIGVKGAGKTSLLECLRFGLGADIPESKKEAVNRHIQAILGPSGSVKILIRREDGSKLIVERAVSNLNFQITFEDDRVEQMTSSDGLIFPITILGWHEIEQAADDPKIRKLYLNIISGKEKIRNLEEKAVSLGHEIKRRHDQISSIYVTYRSQVEKVNRLRELRKGLAQLTESNLIALRDKYLDNVNRIQKIRHLKANIPSVSSSYDSSIETVKSQVSLGVGETSSFLYKAESSIFSVIEKTKDGLSRATSEVKTCLGELSQSVQNNLTEAEQAFSEFAQSYTSEVSKLDPEKQRLLEQHRQIAEETKDLEVTEQEAAATKQVIVNGLNDLMKLCDEVAAVLDEKSSIRENKIGEMNNRIAEFGVRLILDKQKNSLDYQSLSQKYGQGATAFQNLRNQMPERLAHLSYKKFYGSLIGDLTADLSKAIFDYADFSHFLTAFEDDDLKIEFKVGKQGQEYSPINELSAGQRCTAIFPILMKLGSAPLIIDQPEDNLDNRYIAKSISPLIVQDKQIRQIMFTSHNANLVVLSDPESITCFESDGSKGWISSKGFLATKESVITQPVLEILDGGDVALAQRLLKYGSKN